MMDALLLLIAPGFGWERIARAGRGIARVSCAWLIPILALTCAGEAWGLAHWGKWQGQIPHLRKFSAPELWIAEGMQFAITIIIVAVNALFLRSTSGTFQKRNSFSQAFATVAYGLSPIFLLRILDGLPFIPSWLSWAVGFWLCFGLLYHGVPLVMKPDPAHAFGLFLTTMLLLLLTTGLFELGKTAYLSGHFPRLEHFISAAAARPPS